MSRDDPLGSLGAPDPDHPRTHHKSKVSHGQSADVNVDLLVVVLVVHVAIARAGLPLPHHTNGAMFLTCANEDPSPRHSLTLNDHNRLHKKKQSRRYKHGVPSSREGDHFEIRNTLVTLGVTLDRYDPRFRNLLSFVIRFRQSLSSLIDVDLI